MTPSLLRIVFAGTPDFAAAHLEALVAHGFHVVGAYSQPDRPSGRGKKLIATPVKAAAERHGIPVNQPLTLCDAEALATLQAYQPDVLVVVAYGLLLPQAVLDLPRYGCLNVHPSLLPRWRGAAPIERAILANDTESGVCIMQMDAGLDTGPVLKKVRTPIQQNDNSATLTTHLQLLGCEALIEVIQQLPTDNLRATPQDNAHVTYARKLQKDEAQIDWNQCARTIHNQIRALYPRSPAWCLHDGKRLRLIRSQFSTDTTSTRAGTLLSVNHEAIKIACGNNSVLEVFDVQIEGKLPMSIGNLLNGHPDFLKKGQPL